MHSDYELLYLAKENDEKAIQLLITKYKKIINYKVLKYSKDLSDYKEDFYNEALCTLYKSIYNYDDSYTFSTFFNTCLENSLKNYHRNILEKKPIYNKSFVNIREKCYNPESILLENEHYEELKKKIINKLSWKEELVFILKEQNYTPKEISEIIDSNIKSIYTIIDRIRNKVSMFCQIK